MQSMDSVAGFQPSAFRYV